MFRMTATHPVDKVLAPPNCSRLASSMALSCMPGHVCRRRRGAAVAGGLPRQQPLRFPRQGPQATISRGTTKSAATPKPKPTEAQSGASKSTTSVAPVG